MNITSMETTGIKAGASFMNGLAFFNIYQLKLSEMLSPTVGLLQPTGYFPEHFVT